MKKILKKKYESEFWDIYRDDSWFKDDIEKYDFHCDKCGAELDLSTENLEKLAYRELSWGESNEFDITIDCPDCEESYDVECTVEYTPSYNFSVKE